MVGKIVLYMDNAEAIQVAPGTKEYRAYADGYTIGVNEPDPVSLERLTTSLNGVNDAHDAALQGYDDAAAGISNPMMAEAAPPPPSPPPPPPPPQEEPC